MRILLTIALLIVSINLSFSQLKSEKKSRKEVTTTPFQDTWQAKGVEDVDGVVLAGKEVKEGNVRMFLPLSFNPNGELPNTEFKAMGKDIVVMEMYIFNHDGDLVYSSRLKNSWTGRTTTGEKAPEGEYIYLVKARLVPEKTTKVSGLVTLKR